MDDEHLTLLCTAQLAGRLDALPRLFTLIRRVRAGLEGPVALLDLGGACDPAAWENAATEGRAALVVLEAMGYDVACLTGADCATLSEAAARRLLEGLAMAVCGPPCGPHPALPDAVTVRVGPWPVTCRAAAVALPDPASSPGAALIVQPSAPGEPTAWDPAARTLRLAAPSGDELGVVEVTFADGRRPVAVARRSVIIPAGLPPDPTVAAAVDLVRGEARRYQQARSQPEGAGRQAGRHSHMGGAHATG